MESFKSNNTYKGSVCFYCVDLAMVIFTIYNFSTSVTVFSFALTT